MGPPNPMAFTSCEEGEGNQWLALSVANVHGLGREGFVFDE